MTEKIPCALAGCPAGKKIIVGLTVYYAALVILLAAVFIFIWSVMEEALPDGSSSKLIDNVVATIGSKTPFSAKLITNGENAILVIPDSLAILAVLVSGAFGGLIHAIRSFYFHVFEGNLEQAETIRLILRPFSGAILALIFYLVLRAGLGQTVKGTEIEGGSIIFYAAVGALVGMFTDQTVAKLKKVAEAILTKPDEEREPEEKV